MAKLFFEHYLVSDRKLLVGSFISKVFPFVPDGARWCQMVAGIVNALTANNLKLSETI
jgi:hypothetical protein